MVPYDVDELVESYKLPPLPETGGDSPRILILFRRRGEIGNVVLTYPVALAEAKEYANRDDTHGDGWFVGYDLPDDYEPGEIY